MIKQNLNKREENKMIEAVKNLGKKVGGAVKSFWKDENGMGTVEVILIIVGICIADKSRILCGNFRCI